MEFLVTMPISIKINVAQLAFAQFDFEHHVAVAIQPADLCRAAFDGDRRDVAQRHRPVLAWHRQACDGGEVSAHIVGQFDADRDLALRQVELSQAHIVIAGGGDAHGFTDGVGRPAEIGGDTGVEAVAAARSVDRFDVGQSGDGRAR
jgi:hypothetical protein